MDLKRYIRDIPDFPTSGILFRDITPLLKEPDALREAVEDLANYCESQRADVIAGVEARGFLFAAPLAYRLGIPLIPIRKGGKLPFETHIVSYALEYGSDAVEVHTDAISSQQRVVVVDDLLATGGTLAAAASLVKKAGGQVSGLAVLVELTDLKGRDLLEPYDIHSLIKY